MKDYILIYVLISLPLICQSQNITKRELNNIIKESIRVNKAKSVSYSDFTLVADNTDSIFFFKKEIKIFTDRSSPRKNNFCRTLELDFKNSNFVNFQDCQNCKGTPSCYVVTEKSFFSYKILRKGNKIFLHLKNKLEENVFEVGAVKRDEENKIVEFDLIRT